MKLERALKFWLDEIEHSIPTDVPLTSTQIRCRNVFFEEGLTEGYYRDPLSDYLCRMDPEGVLPTVKFFTDDEGDHLIDYDSVTAGFFTGVFVREEAEKKKYHMMINDFFKKHPCLQKLFFEGLQERCSDESGDWGWFTEEWLKHTFKAMIEIKKI